MKRQSTLAEIIMQAVEYCQGNVDPVIEFTVTNYINAEGFWKTVGLYSERKINVDEYKKLNAHEMYKILCSGKALITEKAFITYKYGGAFINGCNIMPSKLAEYEGKVAIVSI